MSFECGANDAKRHKVITRYLHLMIYITTIGYHSVDVYMGTTDRIMP